MSAYKFNDPDGIYFVTFTVVEWVDVFTREEYVTILLDSLRHCQKEKGLVVHGWVIMTNHLHLIISRKSDGDSLSNIIRDYKKFTSTQITQRIETNGQESRKNWMLWIFRSAGKKNPNNKNYQFWKQNNHAEHLITNKFMDQKLEYIHMNPVVIGWVDEPEAYRYSSAIDYAGQKGLLEIEMIQ